MRDGLTIPVVRVAGAAVRAAAADVDDDEVEDFLETEVAAAALDLEGSLTDLEDVRSEGMRLLIPPLDPPPPLLLPSALDPVDDEEGEEAAAVAPLGPESSAVDRLAFWIACRCTAAGWERVLRSEGFQMSLADPPLEELAIASR